MANDRDSHDANTSSSGDPAHHKREIGKGMHSPDSTQMPLKAENAEPDWRTQKNGEHDRSGEADEDRDRQSKR